MSLASGILYTVNLCRVTCEAAIELCVPFVPLWNAPQGNKLGGGGKEGVSGTDPSSTTYNSIKLKTV